MVNIDKTKPILVTGASGYIAGWIIKYLLESGYTVHGTVRNPDNAKSVAHLKQVAANAQGELKLFKADLLSEGSFDDAMQGCELVLHTASPFVLMGFKDANEALIRPALEGTQNVLASVNRTSSVKRVVLTSSIAAIYGDNADLAKYPNQTATEDYWNTSSSLRHQPYSYSKTIAEKAAWDINKKQNRWDLVTINPVMVLGPALCTGSASGSIAMLKQFGDGTTRFGVPDFKVGIVDVRDVAQAHILAGFTPAASGRYITSSNVMSLLEIGKALREKYNGIRYPLPFNTVPTISFWLAAPLFGYKRAVVKRNMGYPAHISNQKITSELGLSFINPSLTLQEHYQQMIDDGLIKSRG